MKKLLMIFNNSFKKNIGISAHIDSGKTTFTERVLFYSGKINSIHDVRGTDGVGATMDSMDLEREKGITIQSAATSVNWKDNEINIIDTPGHVDFTVEVERALKVLDGAVLLICGVSHVQAQTMTVYKQMRTYNVPRIIFINKLDRMGADPFMAVNKIQTKLGINCSLIQIPIGQDKNFEGIIDIIHQKAFKFEGSNGEILKEIPIEDKFLDSIKEQRVKLIETLCENSEEMMEEYLVNEDISNDVIIKEIRKQTIDLKFSPVFIGSAYKNIGIQLILDGVTQYLPNPEEKQNIGFRMVDGKQEKFILKPDSKLDLVCYAFKIDQSKYGQLTYMRVYQGTIRKGDTIYNVQQKKKIKISRLVKMHSNNMEDINSATYGDIFAVFGIDCYSGDTFTNSPDKEIQCSPMNLPLPVISMQINPQNKQDSQNFQKGLQKFQKEDPTFIVKQDPESQQIVISGMGELHLQIYAERLKREFKCPVNIGKPTVNYRETITQKASFDYLHKKQTGGAGQYARIIGYIEPIENQELDNYACEFKNQVIGTSIPNEYIIACEKGFYEICQKGPQTGYQIVRTRFVLTDGVTHSVDSSQLAFKTAVKYAFRQAMKEAGPQIMEPYMIVEISCQQENYNVVMQHIGKRQGLITNTVQEGQNYYLTCEVSLKQMFGFATELRGATSGQGEFSMEYKEHKPVPQDQVDQIKKEYQRRNKLNKE